MLQMLIKVKNIGICLDSLQDQAQARDFEGAHSAYGLPLGR
jgi:hypothetical protein